METMIIYKWITSCFVGIVIFVAWRVWNWVWFQPRRLERILRLQGLHGTSYKFFFGDTKDMAQLTSQANLHPINVSHDIIPRVLPFFHKATKTYGNIFFAWLGPKPLLHVLDGGLMKDILCRNNEFQKARSSNPYTKILSQGVIDYEGQKWFKHRKIINPAFHAHKLKFMAPAMYLSCNEMMDKWEKLISAEKTCELDVFPYLQALTSDVISRTAFGSSYEEGRRVFELQKQLFTLLKQVLHSLYIPGSRYLPTKRNKMIKKIDHDLKSSIRSIIDKRVMAMKGGEACTHVDLLGILLESNENEIQRHGNGMSIEDVIEECKLFYFAGQETTSNLLVWSMVLLSQHPMWQTKAREEVFEVFGDDKLDVDGLNHLKIVTMILNEVLRLYPALSALHRIAKEETKLGDLILPAGTIISLPLLVLHRDREIWGDDSTEFKPDRFSQGVSKATNGQVAYFPFSWGPRICIGQQFALMEAKIALSMILRRFCFVLSPAYAHAPQSFITLQP